MNVMLVAGVALLALTAAPHRLAAQAATSPSIAPTAASLTAAAHLRLASNGPLGAGRPAGELIALRSSGNRRQGEILMIVGAAGLVTGLLVDEDIITIAGAGVAGFGLYLYLQDTR